MHRLMVVVVLALPFVSAQALACGMEMEPTEDQPSALADLMDMVDDAATELAETVVEVAVAAVAPDEPAAEATTVQAETVAAVSPEPARN